MSDDPDPHADVHVRTGDGTTVPQLTGPLFDDLLSAPPDPECPFIVVSRGENDYIQTRLLPDGVYELEHRAGGPDELCHLYTPDAALVRDVMWAWIDGNPWWRDGVAWFPVDPAIAELETTRRELEGLLDGFGVLDDIQSSMDQALARADELLAMDIPDLSIDDVE
ncbi:hypothetical protein [Nocardia sp. NBC_01009]|uniref:hypothetical protein n=1 Tax=Nocardia sp. NBC_01009 TaxID=2975996 RepID=UPI00386D4801|nr:hypothetical protein OHA42_20920 [Nocardia sp. NBC_01009]